MSTTYMMTSVFLIVVLCMIFSNVNKKLAGQPGRFISLTLIGTTTFYVLMDCIWIAEYLSPNYNKTLFTVINFLFYAVYITLPYVWFRFSQYFIDGKLLKNRTFVICTAIPWLFNAALILITMFGAGTVWVIGDAQNKYSRGPMFSIFSNLNLIYYFFPVVEIIYKTIFDKNSDRRYYSSALSFSLVPALGVFIYTYLIPELDIYPFQPFCFFVGVMYAFFFLVDQSDKEMRTEYEKQLNRALSLAQSSNEAKTSFLFNMSHDIRTPMNAILGFTDIAQKNISNPEKLSECFKKIKSSGNLLLSLINSVLEMSRIEAGKEELDEMPCDVNKCFIDIESTMQSLADQKNINLKFEVSDIKDNYIYADVDRANRIFVNIISNAIKYTSRGGHVKVKCEQVGRSDDDHGLYKFTFKDDGIGMSDEFQKHLFDEFSRENSSTLSGVQGSGLGLSVVKAFVELLGGSINCSSKLNEGTTFTVIFPFKIQKNAHPVQYVYPVQPDIAADDSDDDSISKQDCALEGKRILLVEDNDLNREIASYMLADQKMIVEEAVNGFEAVELLQKKGEDYFDAILMDIQMPEMDGYEATRAIRNMYPDADIPIIALSANAFAEDKAKSISAGMNDHLAKPINTSELISMLSKYLLSSDS